MYIFSLFYYKFNKKKWTNILDLKLTQNSDFEIRKLKTLVLKIENEINHKECLI
jgi:thymidylate synthase ThyX